MKLWIARKLRFWAHRLDPLPDRGAWEAVQDGIGEAVSRGMKPEKILVDPETYFDLATLLIEAGQLHFEGARQLAHRHAAEGRLPLSLFGLMVEVVPPTDGSLYLIEVIGSDPCDDPDCDTNPLTMEPCP